MATPQGPCTWQLPRCVCVCGVCVGVVFVLSRSVCVGSV